MAEFTPAAIGTDTGIGTDALVELPPAYAFGPWRRITPSGDDTNTNVDAATNIVLEFDPVQDTPNFPGKYLYPDVSRLRQVNSLLLQQWPSINQRIGGFGLLFEFLGFDGASEPLAGETFPCQIDYEPGYGPKDVVESPGSPMRLRLDPQPGNSTRTLLPNDKQIGLLFERQLPAQALSY